MVELGEIAGYTHDLGNCISRDRHWITGAVLVGRILEEMGMPYQEIGVIMGAIGNHEEPEGIPVNDVSVAVILADKTDVHRSRVRNKDVATFDIHDRVNYAVVHSFLNVEPQAKQITLTLTIETEICPVMEYFEIFLTRMVMCRRAAEFLGCQFRPGGERGQASLTPLYSQRYNGPVVRSVGLCSLGRPYSWSSDIAGKSSPSSCWWWPGWLCST